jgi:RNA polymerase sigma-70 factor, ECF subfamily
LEPAPPDRPPASDAERETALVRRAQAGDAEAYGELVTMHQAAAFRVAYVLLGTAADAEDAAQEGFVRAYLALDRFRTGEPFRPWLLQVVGNEARNRRRARGRRENLAVRAIAAVRGASGGEPLSPAPEVAALEGETQAEVRTALAALDEGERLVVTCRYLLGLSEAETAAALGIPAGTVKSRLHRGLRRLRDRLEPAMGSAEASS